MILVTKSDNEKKTVPKENYRPISSMNSDITKTKTGIILNVKSNIKTHRYTPLSFVINKVLEVPSVY